MDTSVSQSKKHVAYAQAKFNQPADYLLPDSNKTGKSGTHKNDANACKKMETIWESGERDISKHIYFPSLRNCKMKKPTKEHEGSRGKQKKVVWVWRGGQ